MRIIKEAQGWQFTKVEDDLGEREVPICPCCHGTKVKAIAIYEVPNDYCDDDSDEAMTEEADWHEGMPYTVGRQWFKVTCDDCYTKNWITAPTTSCYQTVTEAYDAWSILAIRGEIVDTLSRTDEFLWQAVRKTCIEQTGAKTPPLNLTGLNELSQKLGNICRFLGMKRTYYKYIAQQEQLNMTQTQA